MLSTTKPSQKCSGKNQGHHVQLLIKLTTKDITNPTSGLNISNKGFARYGPKVSLETAVGELK
jgi:hypothetical protein